MKGNEARSVLYLHVVPPSPGGAMETTTSGAVTRLLNMTPGAMTRKRKILFMLTSGILLAMAIGLITWTNMSSSPDSFDTDKNTTATPTLMLEPTKLTNNPDILRNLTTNSTYRTTTNITDVEDFQSDETLTGVQAAFFTSLAPLILLTLLVLLDLWLVGLVPATLRAWRSLTSRPAGVQQLLQTLPYYLALSRSSCQVSHPSSLLLIQFM